MKVQQLIARVEEIKALADYYQNMQQTLAQAGALSDTLDETTTDEERQEVATTVSKLQARLEKVGTLLTERSAASSPEQAQEKLEEHVARLQQYQSIRQEELQLRTQLDLELAMGGVPDETRRQAEAQLSGMQQRKEILVQQGMTALGATRLLMFP